MNILIYVFTTVHKVSMIWFHLLSFRHFNLHIMSWAIQTCYLSQCPQCLHLALKFSSGGFNPLLTLRCSSYTICLYISVPTVCFLEEISHTLFNRPSLTSVSFIQENLDQKTSQKLVLVNIVEQSDNLKSNKSSEISCVKHSSLIITVNGFMAEKWPDCRLFKQQNITGCIVVNVQISGWASRWVFPLYIQYVRMLWDVELCLWGFCQLFKNSIPSQYTFIKINELETVVYMLPAFPKANQSYYGKL